MFGANALGLGFLLSMKDGITREAMRGKSSLVDLERQAKKTGAVMDESIVAAQMKMSSAMKQMQLGAGLMTFGLGLAAGLGVAGKQAADLEESIRNALTMTDLQGKAYDRMKTQMTRQAIALSSELGLAGRDIGESFYQVLSAGAKAGTEGFTALATTALKMSKTVGLVPSQAVESLSDTVHAFGMELNETGKVADAFFQASKLGSTTVPQLTEAMREAAPAAKALNIGLAETSAIMAAFASNGFKSTIAGTSFRMIVNRLASPVAETKKWLDKLNISVFDANGKARDFTTVLMELKAALAGQTDEQRNAALKAIAGEEAFAKLSVILNSDLNLLRQWTRELENSSGALDQALTDKMAGAAETGRQLIEVGRNLIVAMGTPLLSVFGALAQPLITIIKFMGDMATRMPILTGFIATTLSLVAVGATLGGIFIMARGALMLFRAQMVIANAAQLQMGASAAVASGGVRTFGTSMLFAAGATRALKYALWGLTGIGAVLAVVDLLGAFGGSDTTDTPEMPDTKRMSLPVPQRPRMNVDEIGTSTSVPTSGDTYNDYRTQRFETTVHPAPSQSPTDIGSEIDRHQQRQSKGVF